MRRCLIALALACTVAVLAGGAARTPVALAAGGNTIINDCEAHAALTQSYSVTELRQALSTMPASVKEYTSCYDVIQTALLNARGGRGGPSGGGSGGSFLPVPVIVILVVLVLAAGGFGVMALRRRGGSGGGPPE